MHLSIVTKALKSLIKIPVPGDQKQPSTEMHGLLHVLITLPKSQMYPSPYPLNSFASEAVSWATVRGETPKNMIHGFYTVCVCFVVDIFY